ncbi:MAG: hypothetical protein LBQ66_12760 [Planctomycetaceae bacterium]|nr:hypothetical protein [Planctomycetaceae bacterium]
MPTRFGVQFKLVRFYYTQRRAGCPRSSPRRFAEIVGYADIGIWFYQCVFCPNCRRVRRRNRPAVADRYVCRPCDLISRTDRHR